MSSALDQIVRARLTEMKQRTTTATRGRQQAIDSVIEEERLSTTYHCESRSHARAFIDAVFDLQDSTHHHARVVVEGCHVIVETWTINEGITELDEEFRDEVQAIFEDTRCWSVRR